MSDIRDEWFQLLSDEERSRVLIAQIKEEEETKRARINSDGYHVVRGIALGLIGLFILSATCATANVVSDWRRAKACSVAPSTCAAAAERDPR